MHEPQRRPKPRPSARAEPRATRPRRGSARHLAAITLGALALAPMAPARAQPGAESAAAAAEVHAMMAQDPSIAAGTFRYAVHPLAVFYPGTVEGRPLE